jgi:hypothetical protein
MKTSKIILGLVMLIAMLANDNWVDSPSAQIIKGTPRCSSRASQIYFVAGQQVTEVHPGSNGYQLNILGDGVDNFELVQEKYMTSVSVIPGYTNATAAKWQVFFAPNMERTISSIKMNSKCWVGSREYRLTVQVKLTDQ